MLLGMILSSNVNSYHGCLIFTIDFHTASKAEKAAILTCWYLLYELKNKVAPVATSSPLECKLVTSSYPHTGKPPF